MRKRTSLVGILLAAALAGCGSSTAPGVQQAPGEGETAPTITAAPATTPTTTSTSTTAVKPPPALSKKPVVQVPSAPAPKKLVTKDLITGTGKTAKAGDTITVNYVGVLYKGGKEFDSSWNPGRTPFTTALTGGAGGVIQGWVDGIAGMKVGGRRELIIPPSLGYDGNAQGGIPANSTLVFVVDLLAIR